MERKVSDSHVEERVTHLDWFRRRTWIQTLEHRCPPRISELIERHAACATQIASGSAHLSPSPVWVEVLQQIVRQPGRYALGHAPLPDSSCEPEWRTQPETKRADHVVCER